MCAMFILPAHLDALDASCAYRSIFSPRAGAAGIPWGLNSRIFPTPGNQIEYRESWDGKLDKFSRSSKLNYITIFDGPSKRFRTQSFCQWVGN